MAAKNVKSEQRGVSREKREAPHRFVLVGTYKGDQLTDWRGWYNYPVSADDKITGADAAKITELWLFKGTKDERRSGLERAGIHVVIANEIMPDFAATLAANHPDTNVINKGIQARSAA